MAVLPVLPPGPTHRRLQREHDIGAQPRALVSAAYASRAPLPTPMQGSLPAGGLRLCREGVEPSGTRWKVSDYIILLPRTFPVASWVHAERLVHRLVPANDQQRRAVELTRTLVWWLYADLKAWQRDPCPRRAAALKARFERIFTRRTGYVVLDRLLARQHRRKAELLRVLQRPEIPLHTNGSENDIRACVTKRKISGGTMSEAGRTARDVLLGLLTTCRKLSVSFYRYLGDRLYVPGAMSVPPLPGLVHQAAAPA